MATKQGTTDVFPSQEVYTSKAYKGDLKNPGSNVARMQGMYPAAPQYSEEYTGENLRAIALKLLKVATVNDSGHTFGEFDRDYGAAPDFNDIETGAGGLPGHPRAPNIASPEQGTVNPATKPETPPETYIALQNDSAGGYRGDVTLNPAATSAEIAKQEYGQTLVPGESFEGSDTSDL